MGLLSFLTDWFTGGDKKEDTQKPTLVQHKPSERAKNIDFKKTTQLHDALRMERAGVKYSDTDYTTQLDDDQWYPAVVDNNIHSGVRATEWGTLRARCEQAEQGQVVLVNNKGEVQWYNDEDMSDDYKAQLDEYKKADSDGLNNYGLALQFQEATAKGQAESNPHGTDYVSLLDILTDTAHLIGGTLWNGITFDGEGIANTWAGYGDTIQRAYYQSSIKQAFTDNSDTIKELTELYKKAPMTAIQTIMTDTSLSERERNYRAYAVVAEVGDKGFMDYVVQGGLGLLSNVAETLDWLSNPVKATAMYVDYLEGGDGIIEMDKQGKYNFDGKNYLEILASCYQASWQNEGRIAYNYDTGFLSFDVVLEVISDPEFLVGALSKSASKSASNAATDVLVKEGFEDVSGKAIKASFRKATRYGLSEDEAIELAVRSLPEASRSGAKQILSDFMKTSKEYKMAKSLGTLKQAKDAVDSLLLKGTGLTAFGKVIKKSVTGVGSVYKAIKKISVGQVSDAARIDAVERALTKVLNEAGEGADLTLDLIPKLKDYTDVTMAAIGRVEGRVIEKLSAEELTDLITSTYIKQRTAAKTLEEVAQLNNQAQFLIHRYGLQDTQLADAIVSSTKYNDMVIRMNEAADSDIHLTAEELEEFGTVETPVVPTAPADWLQSVDGLNDLLGEARAYSTALRESGAVTTVKPQEGVVNKLVINNRLEAEALINDRNIWTLISSASGTALPNGIQELLTTPNNAYKLQKAVKDIVQYRTGIQNYSIIRNVLYGDARVPAADAEALMDYLFNRSFKDKVGYAFASYKSTNFYHEQARISRLVRDWVDGAYQLSYRMDERWANKFWDMGCNTTDLEGNLVNIRAAYDTYAHLPGVVDDTAEAVFYTAKLNDQGLLDALVLTDGVETITVDFTKSLDEALDQCNTLNNWMLDRAARTDVYRKPVVDELGNAVLDEAGNPVLGAKVNKRLQFVGFNTHTSGLAVDRAIQLTLDQYRVTQIMSRFYNTTDIAECIKLADGMPIPPESLYDAAHRALTESVNNWKLNAVDNVRDPFRLTPPSVRELSSVREAIAKAEKAATRETLEQVPASALDDAVVIDKYTDSFKLPQHMVHRTDYVFIDPKVAKDVNNYYDVPVAIKEADEYVRHTDEVWHYVPDRVGKDGTVYSWKAELAPDVPRSAVTNAGVETDVSWAYHKNVEPVVDRNGNFIRDAEGKIRFTTTYEPRKLSEWTPETVDYEIGGVNIHRPRVQTTWKPGYKAKHKADMPYIQQNFFEVNQAYPVEAITNTVFDIPFVTYVDGKYVKYSSGELWHFEAKWIDNTRMESGGYYTFNRVLVSKEEAKELTGAVDDADLARHIESAKDWVDYDTEWAWRNILKTDKRGGKYIRREAIPTNSAVWDTPEPKSINKAGEVEYYDGIPFSKRVTENLLDEDGNKLYDPIITPIHADYTVQQVRKNISAYFIFEPENVLVRESVYNTVQQDILGMLKGVDKHIADTQKTISDVYNELLPTIVKQTGDMSDDALRNANLYASNTTHAMIQLKRVTNNDLALQRVWDSSVVAKYLNTETTIVSEDAYETMYELVRKLERTEKYLDLRILDALDDVDVNIMYDDMLEQLKRMKNNAVYGSSYDYSALFTNEGVCMLSCKTKASKVAAMIQMVKEFYFVDVTEVLGDHSKTVVHITEDGAETAYSSIFTDPYALLYRGSYQYYNPAELLPGSLGNPHAKALLEQEQAARLAAIKEADDKYGAMQEFLRSTGNTKPLDRYAVSIRAKASRAFNKVYDAYMTAAAETRARLAKRTSHAMSPRDVVEYAERTRAGLYDKFQQTMYKFTTQKFASRVAHINDMSIDEFNSFIYHQCNGRLAIDLNKVDAIAVAKFRTQVADSVSSGAPMVLSENNGVLRIIWKRGGDAPTKVAQTKHIYLHEADDAATQLAIELERMADSSLNLGEYVANTKHLQAAVDNKYFADCLDDLIEPESYNGWFCGWLGDIDGIRLDSEKISNNKFLDLINAYTTVTNHSLNTTQYLKEIFDSGVTVQHTLADLEAHGVSINNLRRSGFDVYKLEFDDVHGFSVSATKNFNAPYTAVLSYNDAAKLSDMLMHGAPVVKSTPSAIKYVGRTLKAFQSMMIQTYLFVNPATWVRNIVDSTTKAGLTEGSSVFGYMLEANHVSAAWDECWEQLVKQEGRGSIDAIRDFFKDGDFISKDGVNLSQRRFLQVKEYKESTLSGGMSKTVSEILGLNKELDVDAILAERLARRMSELKLTKFNATMFSKVEDVNRLAIYLKHMDEGADVSEALKAIDISQFDYSKTKAMSTLNAITPFIQFRLKNLGYWLDGDFGMSKWMVGNIAQLYDYDDNDDDDFFSSEGIRYRAWLDTLSDYNRAQLEGTYQYNKFRDYKGATADTAHQLGWIKIGDDLYFKLGLSLTDAIHATKYIYNPVESIWGDVFAPITNLFDGSLVDGLAALSNIKDAESAELWFSEHGYDVFNGIPLVGTLYYSLEQSARNYLLAQREDRLGVGEMLLTTLIPGLFTADREYDRYSNNYLQRPIGLDWYNQTDEYKATHRYVLGVSYVPAWVAKNPASYVNTWGRLQQLGLSNDEISKLMDDGGAFWFTKNNDGEYQIQNKSLLLADAEAYDKLYADLLAMGWRPEDAERLLEEAGTQIYTASSNGAAQGGYGASSSTAVKGHKPYYLSDRLAKGMNVLPAYNKAKAQGAYAVKQAQYRSSHRDMNTKYRWHYRQRDIYKDNYAKYGASRMAMNQNLRAYSNRSITEMYRTNQNIKYARIHNRWWAN